MNKLFVILIAFFWISLGTNAQVESRKERELKQTFLQASAEQAKGNYDKALTLFSKCESLDKNNAAVQYELSRTYQHLSDLTKSTQHAEKAILLDDSNVWYKIQLAELYYYASLFGEAADVYAKVVEQTEDIPTLLRYAEILIQAGKYQEAIGVYDVILTRNGPNPEIVNQQIRLYLELNKTSEAITLLEANIKDDPTELMYYGILAGIYEDIGEPEKAIQTYNRMAEVDPDNGRIHLALYSHYWYNRDKEKAYNELGMVFPSEDVDIDTKMQLLLDLYEYTDREQTDIRRIYKFLDTLIYTHPDEAKAYSVYGDYLLRDNRTTEARDKFVQAVENDPEKFVIWNQVMFLDLQVNDFNSLLEHSNAALELFPNQPSVYYFNGLALSRLDKNNEAIDQLLSGKAILIDNDELLKEFYQLLGDVYYQTGEKTDAYKNYDAALKLDPKNAYVLNNYAYYLSLDNNQLDKAEEMIAQAVNQFPSQASYLDTYAWVLFKKGNYKDARIQLEKALEKGGNKNPVILEHMGDILYHLKEIETAINYWNQAKEAGGDSEKLSEKINTKKYIE